MWFVQIVVGVDDDHASGARVSRALRLAPKRDQASRADQCLGVSRHQRELPFELARVFKVRVGHERHRVDRVDSSC